MPTESPGMRAGGLVRDLEGIGGIGSSILNEKFTAADELGITSEVDLLVPANRLRAARSVDPNRRLRPLRRNGGDGRGTRAGTRGLGFPHSTLEESRFNLVPIPRHYKFDIHPVRKSRLKLDFGGLRLPAVSESIDERHEVWVAHRHGNTSNFPER